MQTLQTLWATLVELRKNVQSLPEKPKASTIQSPPADVLVKPNDIPDMPPVAPEVLNEFLLQHPSLVYKYVFKALTKAIRDDKETVILFNMPHLGTIARIDRKDYLIALEKMVEHFIKSEEYERIRGCQSLIEKYHVNEIIRNSTR